MLINESRKRSIAFRAADARRLGEGCFYLDRIVWLNGDRIELGDRVGFNYGCYVNGFSGLVIGDDVNFGPYTMIHTADHETADTERPISQQGWKDSPPVRIGSDCWVGMGGVAVGNPAKPVKSRR